MLDLTDFRTISIVKAMESLEQGIRTNGVSAGDMASMWARYGWMRGRLPVPKDEPKTAWEIALEYDPQNCLARRCIADPNYAL